MLDAASIDYGNRFRRTVDAWLIRFNRLQDISLSGHWGTLSTYNGCNSRGQFRSEIGALLGGAMHDVEVRSSSLPNWEYLVFFYIHGLVHITYSTYYYHCQNLEF